MNNKLYDLAEKTVNLLKLKGLTLSSAESCTGGMFSELITSVSGASEVFELGIVSYSSRIKNKILNVSHKTLDTLGAVSDKTAQQMAENVRILSSSDIAVSVTGVAGPSMSEGKPVGLVYIALSADNLTESKRFHFQIEGREFIRQKACEELFVTVCDFLEKHHKKG